MLPAHVSHCKVLLLLFILCLLETLCYSSQRSSNKLSDPVYKLYGQLLQDYNKNIRPMKSWAEATNIEIDVFLLEITNLDDFSGHITFRVWLQLSWTDEYLTWKPKDFNNIFTIYLPFNEIWTPDVKLYNMVEDMTEIDVTRVSVNHTGQVILNLPATYKVTCEHIIPKNLWICHFQFASWSYDNTQLNLTPKQQEAIAMNISQYKSRRYWTVVSSVGEVDENWRRDSSPNPWTMLKYTLELRNKYGPAVGR